MIKFIFLMLFCMSYLFAVPVQQQNDHSVTAGVDTQLGYEGDLRILQYNASLESFNKISIAIPSKIDVVKGTGYRISLFASNAGKNIFDYIHVAVVKGCLMVRFNKRLESYESPDFIGIITMPEEVQLSEISLWDHCALMCYKDIDTDFLNVIVLDHSSVSLQGRADTHTVCIGRTSMYDAKGIKSKETKGTVFSYSWVLLGLPGKITDLKKDSESNILVSHKKQMGEVRAPRLTLNPY